MNSLVFNIFKKLVNPVKVVTWALRAAAEGDLGPQVKAAYWFLSGHKGWLVAAVAAAGAFLVQLHASDPAACAAVACETVLQYVEKWAPLILAGLGVSALDDALRQPPPSR